jgi:hypothetical protein
MDRACKFLVHVKELEDVLARYLVQGIPCRTGDGLARTEAAAVEAEAPTLKATHNMCLPF